jgi:hypothetical protein
MSRQTEGDRHANVEGGASLRGSRRPVEGGGSTLSAAQSQAQDWPQRPVKFIVLLGPGAGVDIGARLLSDRLHRRAEASRW